MIQPALTHCGFPERAGTDRDRPFEAGRIAKKMTPMRRPRAADLPLLGGGLVRQSRA
jgi:hypothetical protein